MEEEIKFNDVLYISSKRAASELHYTKDYVGQLCRGGKVDARLVGRTWYVNRSSLLNHRAEVERQWRDLGKPVVATHVEECTEGAASNGTQLSERCVSDNSVSHRADMRPVPLEDFAMTRMPTRLEIERKLHQDALMSSMDVSYERDKPLFYDDVRPLNPEPYKVTRFRDAPIAVTPKMRYQESFEGIQSRTRGGNVRRAGVSTRRESLDGVVLSPLRPHSVRLSSRAVYDKNRSAYGRNSEIRPYSVAEVEEGTSRKLGVSGFRVLAAVALVAFSLVGAYFVLMLADSDSTTGSATASVSDVGILDAFVNFFKCCSQL